MKSIALVIIIAALAFSGCKKDDKGGSTTPSPEPVRFWVVNMDSSESYRVFGGLMNDTVLLKKGERTKVYSFSNSGSYAHYYVKQSKVDTSYFDGVVSNSQEVTVFIGIPPFQQSVYYSSFCSAPPAGKALVRLVDILGGRRVDLIDSLNNTTTILEGNFNGPYRPTDPCNFITPGRYTVNLFTTPTSLAPIISQTKVELESGQVYFIYRDYGNTIRVLKR